MYQNHMIFNEKTPQDNQAKAFVFLDKLSFFIFVLPICFNPIHDLLETFVCPCREPFGVPVIQTWRFQTNWSQTHMKPYTLFRAIYLMSHIFLFCSFSFLRHIGNASTSVFDKYQQVLNQILTCICINELKQKAHSNLRVLCLLSLKRLSI